MALTADQERDFQNMYNHPLDKKHGSSETLQCLNFSWNLMLPFPVQKYPVCLVSYYCQDLTVNLPFVSTLHHELKKCPSAFMLI